MQPYATGFGDNSAVWSVPGFPSGIPSPEVAYANLGWAYLNLNKPREAEESYRAAVQLQPRFSQAHYFLGVVLDRQGRKDEAKAAFRTARDLDPDSPFGQKAGDLLKAMGEGG